MKMTSQLMLSLALLWLTGSCQKPALVLLVTGGHAYDTTEFHDLFQKMEGIKFDPVSYPDAREMLASDEVDAYDLLVFYDFVPEMDLEDSTIFLRLTAEGKPLMFLHHALCTFQQWEGYKKMVGGRYVMPGFQQDSTLLSDYKHDIDLEIEVLDPDHPVVRGVDDFVIHDEGYSNIQVIEGIHPLLGTNHPDSSPLLAWVNHRDHSTILYMMLGHDRNAYSNNSYQLLLYNSIQWLTAL